MPGSGRKMHGVVWHFMLQPKAHPQKRHEPGSAPVAHGLRNKNAQILQLCMPLQASD